MISKQVRITIFGILISVAISTPIIQLASLPNIAQVVYYSFINFILAAFLSVLYFTVIDAYVDYTIWNKITEWTVLFAIAVWSALTSRFLNQTLGIQYMGLFLNFLIVVLLLWLFTFYKADTQKFNEKKLNIWMIVLIALLLVGILIFAFSFFKFGNITPITLPENGIE